jgi:hypothetical protein
MQEASLLNITNQACGLFNEAEVGFLWTSIAPCFMVQILVYLSVMATFSFLRLVDRNAAQILGLEFSIL